MPRAPKNLNIVEFVMIMPAVCETYHENIRKKASDWLGYRLPRSVRALRPSRKELVEDFGEFENLRLEVGYLFLFCGRIFRSR